MASKVQVNVVDLDAALQKAQAFKNAAEDFQQTDKMLQASKADIDALDTTGGLNERVSRLIDSYHDAFGTLIPGLEQLAKQVENAVNAMAALKEQAEAANMNL